MQEMDAGEEEEKVLVVMSNDASLLDVVAFFPSRRTILWTRARSGKGDWDLCGI